MANDSSSTAQIFLNEAISALPMQYNSLSRTEQDSIVNVTKEYPFEYAIVMLGYILPVVLLITLFTNTLVVMVLAQKHMRSPTNIVLFTMAVVDLMTLLSPSPWYFYIYTLGYHDKFLYPPMACYAHHIMTDVVPIFFHTSSIWLALLLASQRYIYVCHPTIARTWCTIPRVKKAIVSILVIAFLHQLPRFFDNTFNTVVVQYNQGFHLACSNEIASWVQRLSVPHYYMVYFTFRIFFVLVIPCVALITLNCLLFRALKRAEHKRTELLNSKFKLVSQHSRCSELKHQSSFINTNNLNATTCFSGPLNRIDSLNGVTSNADDQHRNIANVEKINLLTAAVNSATNRAFARKTGVWQASPSNSSDGEEARDYNSGSNSGSENEARSHSRSASRCLSESESMSGCGSSEASSNRSRIEKRNRTRDTRQRTINRADSEKSSCHSAKSNDRHRAKSHDSERRNKLVKQAGQESNDTCSSFTGPAKEGRTQKLRSEQEKHSVEQVMLEKDDSHSIQADCDYLECTDFEHNHEGPCARCSGLQLEGATGTRNQQTIEQAVSQCSSLFGYTTTTNEDSSGFHGHRNSTLPAMCSGESESTEANIRLAKLESTEVESSLQRLADEGESSKSQLGCSCLLGPKVLSDRQSRTRLSASAKCSQCCLSRSGLIEGQDEDVQLMEQRGFIGNWRCAGLQCSNSDPCVKCLSSVIGSSIGHSKRSPRNIGKDPKHGDNNLKSRNNLPTSCSDCGERKLANDCGKQRFSAGTFAARDYSLITKPTPGNTTSTTTTTTLYSNQTMSGNSINLNSSRRRFQQPTSSKAKRVQSSSASVGHDSANRAERSFHSQKRNGSNSLLTGNLGSSTTHMRTVASNRIMDSNRTTLMLIVVVTVFLMVEVPVAMVTIVHVVLNSFEEFQDVELRSLDYIKLFTNFLITISYSVNFTIYCSMSKKFRETFWDLFSFNKRAARKRAKHLQWENQGQQHQQQPNRQLDQDKARRHLYRKQQQHDAPTVTGTSQRPLAHSFQFSSQVDCGSALENDPPIGIPSNLTRDLANTKITDLNNNNNISSTFGNVMRYPAQKQAIKQREYEL